MKIIVATHNSGKLVELKSLLKTIEFIPLSQYGVAGIPETGLTFVENALLKARHASRETGLPALADDSGLEVFALQSQPGIYSARYAGLKASMEENIKKLLSELKNVPYENRKARFYCVIVFLKNERDPTPLICEGSWEGYILDNPVGTNGFGYDPIFYVPVEKCSAAELSLDKKNKLSHRGQALRQLIKLLPGK